MNTRNILRHNNSEKKLIINNVNYIDVDKYRDELIKLKQELNKRNKEYQELKVEYLKLEKNNKSNLKLIELIICESDSSGTSNNVMNTNPFYNLNDNNKVNFEDNLMFKEKENDIILLKDDKNINTKNLCKQTIKKLKDKYLYSKMKEEIMHLREEISEKDSLMSHLKSNSKIIKLRELDNKYADTYQELVQLRDKFKKVENIKQDYLFAKNKMSNLFQQLDFYKKQGKKQKEQLEKVSLQNQNYMKIIENNESQKNIEENKRKYYKGENEKLKKQIKDLSEQNYNLLGEIQKLRDKSNKALAKIKNENKKLKEENEKYKKEIENLKKKLLEKDKDNNNKDDFFMTSAKIVGESNANKNDIKENKDYKENKDNINENEISVLEKNYEDKKLEPKDIEIMDFQNETEKNNEKKEEKNEIKEEQKEEQKEEKKEEQNIELNEATTENKKEEEKN